MGKLGIWLVAALLSAVVAHAQETSLHGKTVNIIISSEAGGGNDAFARLVSQYLPAYLPGSPTVVVRNLPGAGGITAMNYMTQQAAADGLTVVTTGNSMADPLNYRVAQSKFDPTEFGIIGGVGRGGEILLINKDAEARLYDKTLAPVVMGSLRGIPRSGMQMTAWGIEYLGWNAKWVTGYRGTGDLLLALERGEIDMTGTSNIIITRKLIESGKFKILLQSGSLSDGKLVGRPDFGGAPIFAPMMEGKIKDPIAIKAFEYWSAFAVTDKWMAVPPKSPKAMLDMHRQAFLKMAENPEFLEKGKLISEGFDPMTAQDVERLLRQLAAIPQEATEYMSIILRKQGLDVQ